MLSPETALYITLLVAFVIFSVVAGFFVYHILRYYKRINDLRNAQVRADVLLLEKERTRVAAELHGEFGAYVSVIKYKLQSLEPGNSYDEQLVAEAEMIIDEMMLKIRQLSYDLMPMLLETKGLRSSLEEFIELLRRSKKFDIEYNYGIDKVATDKKIHFFRIVQEALHNCVKHSKASNIKVLLYENSMTQFIEVSDNGRGFDKCMMSEQKKGIGLMNIQYRARLLNGMLYLDTGPERGTHYTIKIPKHG